MELAIALLKEIVDQNQNTEEKRIVTFNMFGDFAMNIRLTYYIIKGQDIGETETQINLEILRKFNKQCLEFAFPTQTLYNIDSGKMK
jgi:MscS family membrane protein